MRYADLARFCGSLRGLSVWFGDPSHARRRGGQEMAEAKPIFTAEIFRFFADLKKHNKKAWMDANRERYRETVTKPFRRLLEALSPALLELDSNFDVAARGGTN